MRLLLDEAFSRFHEAQPIPWSDFGFRSRDPIPEAVDWCIERFGLEKSIDPAKIPRDSRSFRLFTQVRWWLSQKVTTQGMRAKLACRVPAGPQSPNGFVAADSRGEGEADDRAAEVERFMEALAATLRQLLVRTCADLVAYWLDGTERLRRVCAWPDTSPLPEATPKEKSFHRFDAMFRFWQLHEPVELGQPWRRVFEATMLSPCENEPPYRVPDREISGDGPREIGRARKTACAKLVEGFATQRPHSVPDAIAARLSSRFRSAFLRPTLQHALDIPVGEWPHALIEEVSRGQG